MGNVFGDRAERARPEETWEPDGSSRLQIHIRSTGTTGGIHMLAAIHAEVRSMLFTMRCPEHLRAAVVEILTGEVGAIQIVPLGCCCRFDAMVLKALQSSVVLEPLCLPGLVPPRTPVLPSFDLGGELEKIRTKKRSRKPG